MTDSQKFLAWLLVIGILAILFPPLGVLLVIGNPLLIGLWMVFMVLFIALVMRDSIYFMKSGKMVLLSCFGNIYNLFSPNSPKNDKGKPIYENGTLNSGILVTVPFMTQRQIFPTGEVLIGLQSNVANTLDHDKDPTAQVRVLANIQVQLEQSMEDLGRLVHLIPGAGTHIDFTYPVPEYRYVVNDDSSISTKTENCACLATFLRELLQTPFDEAVGKAIAKFTLKQALENYPGDPAKNDPGIQDRIEERLKEPGTIFTKSRVRECFAVFDINVMQIVSTRKDTTDAIAAKNIAVRQGQATIAKATADGEAKVITATKQAEALTKAGSALSSPGAEMILAAETIGKMPGVQLITGLDPVTAGMSLLAKNKGQPPTPPPAPPATPPT